MIICCTSRCHNACMYVYPGAVCLRVSEECVSQRILLAGPQSVIELRRAIPLEECSRMELRGRLLECHWHFASAEHPLDIEDKRMQQHGSKWYYRCLLHPRVASVPGLSHSASDGYYKAHIAMLDSRRELTHIPVSHPSEWFHRLIKFFSKGGPDPRQEPSEPMPPAPRPSPGEPAEHSPSPPPRRRLAHGRRRHLELPSVPLEPPHASQSPGSKRSRASGSRKRSSSGGRKSKRSSSSRSSSSSPRRSSRSRSPGKKSKSSSGSSSRGRTSRSRTPRGTAGPLEAADVGAAPAYVVVPTAWALPKRGPDLLRQMALEAVFPRLCHVINVLLPGKPFAEQVRYCLRNLPARLQDWGEGRAYSTRASFESSLLAFYERQLAPPPGPSEQPPPPP